MKTQRLLTLLVIMTMLATSAHATLLTKGGSSFDISLLTYEPVPAQPGDVIDVWITVENEGSSAAKDVTLELSDTHPFSIDNEDDRIKKASTIPAQESFLFKTKVRVDADADVGTNYLHVTLRDENGIEQEEDLALTIVGETSSLNVAQVQVAPSVITPGEEASIVLTVENTGDTLLRNVQATLDFDDLDLAPTGSGSSQSITELGGGEAHSYLFPIIADPDAEAGVYKIPLTLSYSDREGNNQTERESIGLVIGSAPELLVYFDSLTLSTNEDVRRGDAVIKVVNKGLDEVKLVQLDVLENDAVKVTSESAQIYVGNIDNDDYENAQLSLRLTNATTVPIRLSYKDSLNREYVQRFDLPVRLTATPEETRSRWVYGILAVLILGALGWWFARRRRG